MNIEHDALEKRHFLLNRDRPIPIWWVWIWHQIDKWWEWWLYRYAILGGVPFRSDIVSLFVAFHKLIDATNHLESTSRYLMILPEISANWNPPTSKELKSKEHLNIYWTKNAWTVGRNLSPSCLNRFDFITDGWYHPNNSRVKMLNWSTVLEMFHNLSHSSKIISVQKVSANTEGRNPAFTSWYGK